MHPKFMDYGVLWSVKEVENAFRQIMPRVKIYREESSRGVYAELCGFPEVFILVTTVDHENQIDAPDRQYFVHTIYSGATLSKVRCNNMNLAFTINSEVRNLLALSINLAKSIMDLQASDKNRLHPD